MINAYMVLVLNQQGGDNSINLDFEGRIKVQWAFPWIKVEWAFPWIKVEWVFPRIKLKWGLPRMRQSLASHLGDPGSIPAHSTPTSVFIRHYSIIIFFYLLSSLCNISM